MISGRISSAEMLPTGINSLFIAGNSEGWPELATRMGSFELLL
jgi:hypothetical protein